MSAEVFAAQTARIESLTAQLQRAAEQHQSDQAALANAQDRWRNAARRVRDLEAHLDAISAAQQSAVLIAREQLDKSSISLESRLTITFAMTEVATKIGVARMLPTLEPIPQQKRCNAVSKGRQCINEVAFDKVSICAGPHDYSRPKLLVVGGDEHLAGATK